MIRSLAHPARASRRDFWSRLQTAIMLHRSRKSLQRLDAHLLDDIGLSRSEALDEATRPLWDAPAIWKR